MDQSRAVFCCFAGALLLASPSVASGQQADAKAGDGIRRHGIAHAADPKPPGRAPDKKGDMAVFSLEKKPIREASRQDVGEPAEGQAPFSSPKTRD